MHSTSPEYSVVLADDHPIIVDAVSEIIRSEPAFKLHATASSGEEVIRIFETAPPDILISDIRMGQMSGIELCSVIRKNYPATKILIITQHIETSIIDALLEIEVNGIVSKESGCGTYIDALQTIISGNFYFSEDISHVIIRLMQSKRKSPTSDFKLTRREKQVLIYLSEEKTTKEIAAEMGISFNTVETYRKNLITKFDVKSTVGLIKKALKKGFIKH